MNTPRLLLGLLAALFAFGFATPAAKAQTAASLYQRVEQSMTNSTSFANPFADTELRLAVTAPSGRALGSSFTWYGFHDGNGSGGQTGNVWKFRLLFDHPGLWTVTAGFYQPGTNTANGPSQVFQYNVSSTPAAGQRGHIRIDPLNPARFVHDDGTHCVPFSMHADMLLDRASSVSNDWTDQHAALGVNAFGVGFHSEVADELGDPGQYHYLRTNGTRAVTWPGAAGFDYGRYDVAAWRYDEQAMDYAHAHGIKLFIWFGISGKNRQYGSYGPLDQSSDGQTLGPLQQRFIRYFLARWATHPVWWHWTVDSEWEETNGSNPAANRAFQIAYANALRTQNPWRTLVSNHSLNNWTLGGPSEGWSHATIQRRITDNDSSAATQGAGFIEANDHHGMPVFNIEGVWSLSNSTRTRVSSLNHFFAGGFSHIAHIDGAVPVSLWSWAVNWNTVTQNHKNDAVVAGALARFFNRPDIDLNAATPAHSLVTVSTGSRYCLAEPGQLYAVWVTHGGTVSLNLSGVTGQFGVTRYAGASLPASGGGTALANVNGGGTVSLGTTPTSGFGQDYLFIVRNLAQGPSITVTSPNGGETWSAGGTAQVAWNSSAFSGNVEIALSTNNGSSWTVLSASEANDGSATVNVPANSATTAARIRVRAASGGTPSDMSNAAFTISSGADTTPPTLSITSPANSTTHGADVTFTGTAADGSGVALVQYRVASGSWQNAAGTTSWIFTLTGQSTGTRNIDVRAIDASSNANTSALVSRTLTFDATPPVLSNIQTAASATSAIVTWTSNEVSDSRVQYGLVSGVYDNETGVVQTGVTSHSVTLSPLVASQTYHYVIITADTHGNTTVSPEQTFTTTAGSGGGYVTVVQSDFAGTSPALNPPWTPTTTLASGLTYSGWTKGSGVLAAAGDDRFVVSFNMPAAEADATLANAIATNAYWSVSVGASSGTLDLRSADIGFTVQRLEYHSPRRYAVFTSVGGFTSPAVLFETPASGSTAPQVFNFQLPDTSAYAAVSGPVEIRIYGYAGQYYSKDTALSAFSLSLLQSAPPSASWSSQDVGGVGQPGSTSHNPSTGVFTVQASGTDIFSGSDEFRFVTLDGGLVGDGEIVARVASIGNTHSWAKAGLMIRDGLAANARNVAVVVSPNNNASLQSRSIAGGSTATTNASSLGAPRWLRLVRSGDDFTGYHSANGTTWTQLGSTVSLSLPSNLQIGLCVTSHNDSTLTTAAVDNVDITP